MSTTGIALLSITVGPKTLDDAHQLAWGLARLMAEDPALRATTDQVTGDVVIAGVSELHLKIVLDRLRREFRVRPPSAVRGCPARRRSRVPPTGRRNVSARTVNTRT